MQNTQPVEKLERGGKVAVVISRGFGAGWSTWNREHKGFLLFDKGIAEAVLERNIHRAYSLAHARDPDIYTGADDLDVVWVPAGARFEVKEYDGSESVRLEKDIPWLTA